MSVSHLALKEPLRVKGLFETIKYQKEFLKLHPTYFHPDGFVCFVGPQGSGKTLSAVNYVHKLMEMYPRCKLCTNVLLENYPIVTFEEFYNWKFNLELYDSLAIEEQQEYDDLMKKRYYKENRVFLFESPKDFQTLKNGEEGVIFLIDEIHLYFGSMKGANNIDPASIQNICQQRKQRIHIVSTTQYYGQLNINLRRHFDSVIVCKKRLFGYLQNNLLVNRDSIKSDDSSGQILDAKISKKYWYFKNPMMFKRYDTYQIINNKSYNVALERNDFNDNRLSSNNRLTS